MRKYILLYLIVLSFLSGIYSQPNYLDLKNIEPLHNATNDLFFLGRRSTMSKEIKKNIPKWETSNLLSSTGDTFPVQARYHKQLDEIQILVGKQTMTLYPHKVRAISIGQNVYITSAYKLHDQEFIAYFELLSEGKINLLFRQEHSHAPAKGKSCFYSMEKDKMTKPVKQSNKFLLKLFGKKKNEISTFINDQKLKPSKKNDLVKIFNYYNKLVE